MRKLILVSVVLSFLLLPLFSSSAQAAVAGYRNIKFKCGSEAKWREMGGESSCKVRALWSRYASDACESSCSDSAGDDCGLTSIRYFNRCTDSYNTVRVIEPADEQFVKSHQILTVRWSPALLSRIYAEYFSDGNPYGAGKLIPIINDPVKSPYLWEAGYGQEKGGMADGVYRIRICPLDSPDTIFCPSSPPIHLNSSDGAPVDNIPVISGISGPVSLRVGQQGTWNISASVASGHGVNYRVIWGDEGMPGVGMTNNSSVQTSASFTHVYSQAGTYTPKFFVYDTTSGGQAVSSISVQVIAGEQACGPIPSTCPAGYALACSDPDERGCQSCHCAIPAIPVTSTPNIVITSSLPSTVAANDIIHITWEDNAFNGRYVVYLVTNGVQGQMLGYAEFSRQLPYLVNPSLVGNNSYRFKICREGQVPCAQTGSVKVVSPSGASAPSRSQLTAAVAQIIKYLREQR